MLERDGTQVENQFKGGRLAVWIGGPWVLGSIDRAPTTRTGSRRRARTSASPPMPTGPAGKAFTFVGGSNLMMFKSSKNQNEAWALMKYLSSDAVQKDYADLLGMFPARLEPQEQVGDSDDNHKAFFAAIQAGPHLRADPAVGRRSRTPTRTASATSSTRLRGRARSPTARARCKSQLDAAAKEADALLAQGG